MSPAGASSVTPTRHAKPIPPHAGDHLSASEFLRRYEAADEQVKAELINGVVCLMFSAPLEAYGKPDSLISMW